MSIRIHLAGLNFAITFSKIYEFGDFNMHTYFWQQSEREWIEVSIPILLQLALILMRQTSLLPATAT